MKMKNETYDILKWVAMLLLPALATLISALGNIWGLPWAPQVSDTIVAVNAALAMILGISTINYQKEAEG
jgi:uncharacterized protein (DUF697 family)